jgi:hypothetical protein
MTSPDRLTAASAAPPPFLDPPDEKLAPFCRRVLIRYAQPG